MTRRFSSLCFGTVKVPRSRERSSEDAVMNPRDVARAARRAIEIAHERVSLGEALLIFGEGSRSRNAKMQESLPGTARYLEVQGTSIHPIGITGTEKLFPMDRAGLHPVPITITIGEPISASDLRKRFDRESAAQQSTASATPSRICFQRVTAALAATLTNLTRQVLSSRSSAAVQAD